MELKAGSFKEGSCPGSSRRVSGRFAGIRQHARKRKKTAHSWAYSSGHHALRSFSRKCCQSQKHLCQHARITNTYLSRWPNSGIRVCLYADPHTEEESAEVLLTALGQDRLEGRVAEALPWVAMQYGHGRSNWLVEHARKFNLQNRLGFSSV